MVRISGLKDFQSMVISMWSGPGTSASLENLLEIQILQHTPDVHFHRSSRCSDACSSVRTTDLKALK